MLSNKNDLTTNHITKGIVMFNLRKIVSFSLFILQCSMVLWLSQRSTLDVFSQLVLLPVLLLAGLALFSLKNDSAN